MAAVQRREHIDEHDLAVEAGEVIAEERPHHIALVGLVAPRHQRPQRAAWEARCALGIERREGQRRRAFEIARHEEAPRGQSRQRVLIGPRRGQIRLEQVRQLCCVRFVGRFRRVDGG